MDKRKIALTIGKLFGTAIGLTLVLVTQLLIEGLQASLKFGVWAMDKLNQPVMQIELPTEIKAIGPAKEINAIAAVSEIAIDPVNAIAAALEITGTVIQFPIKFPVNPNLWMVKELPREYLNVKSLKGWAKDRQIKGYGKMIKGELIKVLAR